MAERKVDMMLNPGLGASPLVSVISTQHGNRVALRVLGCEGSGPQTHAERPVTGGMSSQIKDLAPPLVAGIFSEPPAGHRLHGGPPSHCVRCLIDASPFPAIAFDAESSEGRIVSANTPFVKEFVQPGASLPIRLSEYLGEGVLASVRKIPDDKTLSLSDISMFVSHRLERTYDVHVRRHRLPNGSAKAVGLMFFSESTDRRRLQSRLRESEDIRQVLEGTTTEAVVRFSPDGVITYASPSSEILGGYAPVELLGRSAYEFVHPEESERLTRTHRSILESGALTVFEHRFRHKDGTWRTFETRARAVRHPETGEILEVHAAQRDLTDLRRGNQEKQLGLEAELSAVRTSMRSLTHDLSNIFSAMLVNEQFLEEELAALPGPPESADIAEIKVTAKELGEAIQRALQMVRDFRRSDVSSAAVDLNILLKPTSLSLILGARHRVDVSLCQTPALIRWHSGELIRMIDNFVVNAREAMAGTDKPCLKVETNIVDVDELLAFSLRRIARPLEPRKGRFVRMRISDNGQGIEEGIIDRIFEIGFSTKDGLGASRGDGMPMVVRCLEGMKGFLTLETSPGLGTTFAAYMPTSR